MVRSSYDPDYLPDVDRHLVRLALLSAEASVTDATLATWAAAHEQSLLVIGTDVHEGRLPPAQSLLVVSEGDVAICGLKWAESGDGLVVRLTNTDAKPAVVTLACAPAQGTVQSAQPLDLMERATDAASPGTGGVVSLTVPANSLGTWLIRTTENHA